MKIIRLDQNMKGNFTGKKAVTPIGITPYFSFSAKRDRDKAPNEQMKSEYGDISTVPYLLVGKNSTSSEVNEYGVDFFGEHLHLHNIGFARAGLSSKEIENFKMIMGIKFRILSGEASAITANRVLSCGVADSIFYNLHFEPTAETLKFTSFNIKGGTVNMEQEHVVIDQYKVGDIVTAAVLLSGSDSLFTIDGVNFIPCPINMVSSKNYINSISVNNNTSLTGARYQRIKVYSVSAYADSELKKEHLKNLWDSLN